MSARSSVSRSAGLAGGEISSRMFLSEPSLALQALARDSLHDSAAATGAVPASHGSLTGSAVTAVSQQADAAAGVHSAGAPSDANNHPPVQPPTLRGPLMSPTTRLGSGPHASLPATGLDLGRQDTGIGGGDV